ncbi:MAG: CIA30 family protein [Lamprobacter sp.]|uniref:CIA30 family protein n=1 Tax=Lamprobacter sp. TaxID=3100796 RepID=UPI002B25834D|nr:CIA30 family protein [Lamprobacter sp.]MEA3640210.1 CIA30 family protein [Lamprobacter sp.]
MTNPVLAVASGLIDNFHQDQAPSRLGTRWRLATDQVMGGLSEAQMTRALIDGRPALCLTGTVSLENNGGFVQINLDLSPEQGLLDASAFAGVRLIVRGDGADYNVHLKTSATRLPWQSYRSAFQTGPIWQEARLPFSSFEPHRLVPRLDPSRLKRLGIVAIGQAMRAEVCIAEIGFY